MAAAFQMGLSGILKSNCISGRMSGAGLFLCLPLTVFERMLSDREMPNSTADGEFLSVLEASRFLSPQHCQVAVRRE